MPKRRLVKIEAMIFAAYLKIKEVQREVEREASETDEAKKKRREKGTLVLLKGGKSD